MAFRTNKTPVLQEKSASGAVATFNTALAMPLSSCNIAVNAWQEGSGDPSPVNNRPIHGFSEVNTTRAGKNLYNGVRTFANPSNTSSLNVNRTFTPNSYCLGLTSNNYMSATLPPSYISDVKVDSNSISFYNSSTGGTAYITLACPVIGLLEGKTYIVSGNRTNCNLYISFYKEDGTYIGYEEPNVRFTVPAETYYTCLVFRAAGRGTVSYTNIQLEYGSIRTAYEPYVTPTIYTIQLGQEVYGAEVDAVNGVAHVTRIKKVIDETSGVTRASNGILYLDNFFEIPEDTMSVKCNCYTRGANRGTVSEVMNNNLDYSFCCKTGGTTQTRVMIKDTRFNTIEEFNEWVALNPISVLIMLAEPFDIQLTPTQIETIRGNNTIFADTGDIDLTFKDLDIAKRGNFREVFKLPS